MKERKIKEIREIVEKIIKYNMEKIKKNIKRVSIEMEIREKVKKVKFIGERVRLLPQTPYRLSPSRSTPALSFWNTSFLPF